MSDNLQSRGISAAPEDQRRRPPPASRRRSGSRDRAPGGRLIGFTLVLAVLAAGLAVAGWFIANQQKLLDEEQARAAAAEARIQALEERLRMTDQVMSETGAETGEQIDLWESEIRKLWAVANERNKRWIQDNQKLLQSHKATIEALEATDKSLKSTVARHDDALGQQQQVADQLAAIDLHLQRIARGQRDLVDRVNTATQTVAAMKADVADNDEAIAAIDAYRRQFNSRLADIQQQLDAMRASPAL